LRQIRNERRPATRMIVDDHATARRTLSEDEYAQEFECSFEAAVRGA